MDKKSKKMDYRDEILALLLERGTSKTICPSEVLTPEQKQNKGLMEQVRQCAEELVLEGKIEITQKGRVVEPGSYKGPIRLKLK
jgi:hypothetical protein